MEIKSTESIKNMKKKIAEHFNVHPYDLVLYKRVLEYAVELEDHGESSSDASLSSVHTELNLKQKEKVKRIKSATLE
jgi:hypothetical protein